jgi:hypothetical protein
MLYHGITEGTSNHPGPIQFREINGLRLTHLSPETNAALYTLILINPRLLFLGILLIAKDLNRSNRTIAYASLTSHTFISVNTHLKPSYGCPFKLKSFSKAGWRENEHKICLRSLKHYFFSAVFNLGSSPYTML